VLDVADRILVVCTPEISTTHNTSRFLEVAQVLDYAHKLTLVLNRANSGVRMDAMESTLGLPVSATIVSAGRPVVDAANQGMALVTKDPRRQEQVTRDLGRLIDLVAGRAAPEVASWATSRDGSEDAPTSDSRPRAGPAPLLAPSWDLIPHAPLHERQSVQARRRSGQATVELTSVRPIAVLCAMGLTQEETGSSRHGC
jgi:hypothetical protein